MRLRVLFISVECLCRVVILMILVVIIVVLFVCSVVASACAFFVRGSVNRVTCGCVVCMVDVVMSCVIDGSVTDSVWLCCI